MNLLPPAFCVVCRGPIQDGHKIRRVLVCARPPTYGVLRIFDDAEAMHLQCAAPTLRWRHREVPRTKLPMGTQPASIAPSHQCLVCRQTFQPGDRLSEVYVVEGVGIDPGLNAPAIKCAGEAEYAHINCADRKLTQGRETLLVTT